MIISKLIFIKALYNAGLIAIAGASTGQLAGGIAARLMKLKIRGMLKMNVILCVINVSVQAVLISLYCKGPDIAGVNVEYINT